MAKMKNNMFENGDPWDHMLNVTATLENLIVAHNNLTEDMRKVLKKQAILEARLQEIKRLTVNEHSMDNIKRS